VHFSYKRYLENRLRDAFGFGGAPMRLIFRERARIKLEPRREARARRAQPRKNRPSGGRGSTSTISGGAKRSRGSS
jgi:hypothetical protein